MICYNVRYWTPTFRTLPPPLLAWSTVDGEQYIYFFILYRICGGVSESKSSISACFHYVCLAIAQRYCAVMRPIGLRVAVL